MLCPRVLSKQPGLVEFFGVGCFITTMAYFKQDPLRRLAYRLVLLISGFLLILVGMILYFFMKGALDDFLFYFWNYNTTYYVAELTLAERLWKGGQYWYFLFNKFFMLFTFFIVQEVCLLIRFFWRRRHQKPVLRNDFMGVFAIWGVMSFVGTSLSGRNFDHYFIQVLPAFSIIVSIGMYKSFEMIRQLCMDNTLKNNISIGSILLGGGGVAIFLTLLGATVVFTFIEASPSQPSAEESLVEYLLVNSNAKDRIFVWGFYPEIYILTGRRAASRYTFTNVLTGLIPWTNADIDVDTTYAIVPGTWEILMDELQENKPLFIVDTSVGGYRKYAKYPIKTFPQLYHFLQTHYALDHRVLREDAVAFDIFKRKELNMFLNLESSFLY